MRFDITLQGYRAYKEWFEDTQSNSIYRNPNTPLTETDAAQLREAYRFMRDLLSTRMTPNGVSRGKLKV